MQITLRDLVARSGYSLELVPSEHFGGLCFFARLPDSGCETTRSGTYKRVIYTLDDSWKAVEDVSYELAWAESAPNAEHDDVKVAQAALLADWIRAVVL